LKKKELIWPPRLLGFLQTVGKALYNGDHRFVENLAGEKGTGQVKLEDFVSNQPSNNTDLFLKNNFFV